MYFKVSYPFKAEEMANTQTFQNSTQFPNGMSFISKKKENTLLFKEYFVV